MSRPRPRRSLAATGRQGGWQRGRLRGDLHHWRSWCPRHMPDVIARGVMTAVVNIENWLKGAPTNLVV